MSLALFIDDTCAKCRKPVKVSVNVARCFCAFMVMLLTCVQPSAKAGGFHSEDRYNPQHIQSLPPEVRNAIMHKCATPRALHDFANYSENLQRIVLHFE